MNHFNVRTGKDVMYLEILDGQLSLKSGRPPELEALNRFVGGWVQMVYHPSPIKGRFFAIVINDEGVRLALPPNVYARPWGTLLGPVMIFGGEVDNENALPLTQVEVDSVRLHPNASGVPILRFDTLPVAP